MKWEEEETYIRDGEVWGLPERDMKQFKAYVNEKTPGVYGTYAALLPR